jgi:twinkle protein
MTHDADESTFVRHEACPSCGSRDNLARYSDGHGVCFGCGHYQHPDGAAIERPAYPKGTRMDLLDGEIKAIANRGLTAETCEKYGYKVGSYRGQTAHIAPYFNEDTGMLAGQKIRYKSEGKKAFTWTGDPKECGLFGQRLCRTAGKMIVITEGEIDALSVAQAMGLRWPAISVPNGAQGAKRDLAKHVGWLETFESIVLCFDMDEPGQKAAREVVTMFTPGKVKIAHLPLKDASDMLVANRSAELVDAIWGAKVYRPDGVRTVADIREKAMTPTTYGMPWPWRGLTERDNGIQRRYLYTWGAGVGTGKTTAMKQIMLTAMRPDLLADHSGIVDGYGKPLATPEPRKIGTVFFEESPHKTLRWLAGMAIGKRLNDPAVVATDAEINAAIDSFDGLFFPLDQYGAKDWESVKANILYLVLSEGVKDIFVDPLTALVAGEDDERRALDAMMADMSGMVEAHDFTMHLVSHLTTPQGAGHEEGGRVLEKQFTGSRAIARWSHAMLGLERDKQDPNSATTVRILKNRDFGHAAGPAIGLRYDLTTGRMIECPLDGASPYNMNDESDRDL